jgi:hypothetical protein
MRIFESKPPVAMREPSGCTWTEKMDKRLEFWSSFPALSLWMTQDGFVNRIVGGPLDRRSWWQERKN